MLELKIIKIGKKKYFLDKRLKQLRNIKNPCDYIDLENKIEFLLIDN